MAGDWIKMRSNLWDDPRIARLVDLTDSCEAAAIGALYWLWATADQHSVSGVLNGLNLRLLDRKTGVQGIGSALVEVGWVVEHPAGIQLVRFEEHNGATAKKRCQTAKRVASHLTAIADVTRELDDGNAASVTGAFAREEKRREEELQSDEADASSSTPNASRTARTLPQVPCPYVEIVGAYHEVLPDLSRVRLETEKRRMAMRKFWAWIFATPRSDGTPRATTGEEALVWIRGYFDLASQNDWLMGRLSGRGHEGWKADFDFLLTEKGRKHVIEKTRVRQEVAA